MNSTRPISARTLELDLWHAPCHTLCTLRPTMSRILSGTKPRRLQLQSELPSQRWSLQQRTSAYSYNALSVNSVMTRFLFQFCLGSWSSLTSHTLADMEGLVTNHWVIAKECNYQHSGDAIYEEHRYDWSHQIFAMVTIWWLQCDNTLCEKCGLWDLWQLELA